MSNKKVEDGKNSNKEEELKNQEPTVGRADVLSERTAEMSQEEREELQKQVADMSEDDLKAFRNAFDPDSMGFFGEEGDAACQQ